jgi:hypothetical protein
MQDFKESNPQTRRQMARTAAGWSLTVIGHPLCWLVVAEATARRCWKTQPTPAQPPWSRP